jgi:signal peptidase II
MSTDNKPNDAHGKPPQEGAHVHPPNGSEDPARFSTMRQSAMVVLAAVIACDQFSKWLILEVAMQPPRTIEVTSFFNLVLWFNPGISFGFFSTGSNLQTWLLIGLATLIVGVLFYWLKDTKSWMTALAIGSVAGGAIGNVVDRLLPSRGAVVDFLDFHAFGVHFPAFNVADSAIVVGVFVLLASSLVNDRKVAGENPGKTHDGTS